MRKLIIGLLMATLVLAQGGIDVTKTGIYPVPTTVGTVDKVWKEDGRIYFLWKMDVTDPDEDVIIELSNYISLPISQENTTFMIDREIKNSIEVTFADYNQSFVGETTIPQPGHSIDGKTYEPIKRYR